MSIVLLTACQNQASKNPGAEAQGIEITEAEGRIQDAAHASAAGMIYSFYGWISVGNMNQEWLAEGELPPTFYVYGTKDPFYRQFERQYQVIRDMGIPVERIVL